MIHEKAINKLTFVISVSPFQVLVHLDKWIMPMVSSEIQKIYRLAKFVISIFMSHMYDTLSGRILIKAYKKPVAQDSQSFPHKIH